MLFSDLTDMNLYCLAIICQHNCWQMHAWLHNVSLFVNVPGMIPYWNSCDLHFTLQHLEIDSPTTPRKNLHAWTAYSACNCIQESLLAFLHVTRKHYKRLTQSSSNSVPLTTKIVPAAIYILWLFDCYSYCHRVKVGSRPSLYTQQLGMINYKNQQFLYIPIT